MPAYELYRSQWVYRYRKRSGWEWGCGRPQRKSGGRGSRICRGESSLVDQLGAMAPGLDIRGPVSIGQVGLIDSAGRLQIASTDDPAVMEDKETYIKEGMEAPVHSCLLAVTLKIPLKHGYGDNYRLSNPANTWIEPIIAAIYRIILRTFPVM